MDAKIEIELPEIQSFDEALKFFTMSINSIYSNGANPENIPTLSQVVDVLSNKYNAEFNSFLNSKPNQKELGSMDEVIASLTELHKNKASTAQTDYLLGLFHYYGLYTGKKLASSEVYFESAAKKKYAPALYMLGRVHEELPTSEIQESYEVETSSYSSRTEYRTVYVPDLEKAKKYYFAAAEQGYSYDYTRVGKIFGKGSKGSQHLIKAAEYYSLAETNGYKLNPIQLAIVCAYHPNRINFDVTTTSNFFVDAIEKADSSKQKDKLKSLFNIYLYTQPEQNIQKMLVTVPDIRPEKISPHLYEAVEAWYLYTTRTEKPLWDRLLDKEMAIPALINARNAKESNIEDRAKIDLNVWTSKVNPNRGRGPRWDLGPSSNKGGLHCL
jgi:TPR repeat protein